VATPLERQIGQIAGVTQMTSFSTLGAHRSRFNSISTATSNSREQDAAAIPCCHRRPTNSSIPPMLRSDPCCTAKSCPHSHRRLCEVRCLNPLAT
jgi:HAE1 family hydrophobic/amphiphilic exporter-1